MIKIKIKRMSLKRGVAELGVQFGKHAWAWKPQA